MSADVCVLDDVKSVVDWFLSDEVLSPKLSDRIKNSVEEICEILVELGYEQTKRTDHLLEYLSDDMRNNREVLMTALINCPYPTDLIQDKVSVRIISKRVTADGADAPVIASKFGDPPKVTKKKTGYQRLATRRNQTWGGVGEDERLKLVPLMRDIEFLKEVSTYINVYNVLPEAMRDDENIFRIFFDGTFESMYNMGPALRLRKDIAMEMVARNNSLYEYLSDDMKKEKDITDLITDDSMYPFLPLSARMERKRVLRLLDTTSIIVGFTPMAFVPEELLDDIDFMYEMVRASGNGILHIKDKYMMDIGLAMESVRYHGWSIRNIRHKFQKNRSFIVTAAMQMIRSGTMLEFIKLPGADSDGLDCYNFLTMQINVLNNLETVTAYLSTGANVDSLFHNLSFLWYQVPGASMFDLLINEDQCLYLTTHESDTTSDLANIENLKKYSIGLTLMEMGRNSSIETDVD